MTSQGCLQMLRPSLHSTLCWVSFSLASITLLWKKWKWNQNKQNWGAPATTGQLIAKISLPVLFFLALKLLSLDCVLHFGRPFFYRRPAAQSRKYFGFKSRSTISLLCDPGEVFWLYCASFLIHESQSLGMTGIKQYLLDMAVFEFMDL